jgi:hypothetical protein
LAFFHGYTSSEIEAARHRRWPHRRAQVGDYASRSAELGEPI